MGRSCYGHLDAILTLSSPPYTRMESGVDGEEAKKRIEEDIPGLRVQILPEVRFCEELGGGGRGICVRFWPPHCCVSLDACLACLPWAFLIQSRPRDMEQGLEESIYRPIGSHPDSSRRIICRPH